MIQFHHNYGLQLAVLFLAFAPLSLLAQTNDDLAKWEPEMKAFEKSDHAAMPPKGAVLFVGSSTFRFWSTMSNDFAGTPIINRGFGGSQISDSTALAERIIFPYGPRMIVLYAGDNDLALGKSPDQVVADYRHFLEKVRSRLPNVPIAYLAIKPSVARWKLKDKIMEVNHRIAEIQGGGDHLMFIDAFAAMLGADGKPRPDLLKADGLHPNAEGYKVLTAAIEPYLK